MRRLFEPYMNPVAGDGCSILSQRAAVGGEYGGNWQDARMRNFTGSQGVKDGVVG